MNTQVTPNPPHIGPATGRLSKDRASDVSEMLHLLQVNHITFLNSWYSRNEASHTFRFGSHEAQLDDIMVRQSDALDSVHRSPSGLYNGPAT